MTCLVCQGTLENQVSNFIADLGDCIIIVKNVPSQICDQCGETSYSQEVAKKLEEIVNKMKSSLTEVAIIHYDRVA